MAKYLTKREKDVLGFIKEFSGKNGFAPSLDEIRIAMGLSSISTIHEHVTKLILKGFLERHPNKARSMQIKDDDGSTMKITTLQDLVSQSEKELGVLKPEEIFHAVSGGVAVVVQGNSLSNEGVMSGDYIIVIPGNGLMDGDTVIGLIDGFKPVLGKLYHFGSKIVIKPINNERDSTVIDPESIVIVGRVKGIFRQL